MIESHSWVQFGNAEYPSPFPCQKVSHTLPDDLKDCISESRIYEKLLFAPSIQNEQLKKYPNSKGILSM